jgi:hypothetical protein
MPMQQLVRELYLSERQQARLLIVRGRLQDTPHARGATARSTFETLTAI